LSGRAGNGGLGGGERRNEAQGESFVHCGFSVCQKKKEAKRANDFSPKVNVIIMNMLSSIISPPKRRKKMSRLGRCKRK
jgi:hypothetical protein